MGIFNFFKANNEKNRDYIFIIYDSRDFKDGRTGVLGIGRGDNIQLGDRVYILTGGSNYIESRIGKLESEFGEDIEEGQANSFLKLYLEDVDLKDLSLGDIVARKKPEENMNKPLRNTYLEGLLLERRLNNNSIVEEKLYKEIYSQANFVSLIYKEGYILNGERYYYPPLKLVEKSLEGENKKLSLIPIFTSRRELEKWAFYKDQELSYMDFDFISELIVDLDNFNGVSINPFTDNLIMDEKIIKDLSKKKKLDRE